MEPSTTTFTSQWRRLLNRDLKSMLDAQQWHSKQRLGCCPLSAAKQQHSCRSWAACGYDAFPIKLRMRVLLGAEQQSHTSHTAQHWQAVFSTHTHLADTCTVAGAQVFGLASYHHKSAGWGRQPSRAAVRVVPVCGRFWRASVPRLGFLSLGDVANRIVGATPAAAMSDSDSKAEAATVGKGDNAEAPSASASAGATADNTAVPAVKKVKKKKSLRRRNRRRKPESDDEEDGEDTRGLLSALVNEQKVPPMPLAAETRGPGTLTPPSA